LPQARNVAAIQNYSNVLFPKQEKLAQKGDKRLNCLGWWSKGDATGDIKPGYGFCGISLKEVTGYYKNELELRLQKCSDAVVQGRYHRFDRSPEDLVLNVVIIHLSTFESRARGQG